MGRRINARRCPRGPRGRGRAPDPRGNLPTHTLFNVPSCLPKDDCYDNYYDPVDSFEIPLFDELDAFYACGQDANMNYAYGDELAIVPYVKHEIVAIAPTHVLGNVAEIQNFPTCHQDLSMEKPATRGRRVSVSKPADLG